MLQRVLQCVAVPVAAFENTWSVQDSMAELGVLQCVAACVAVYCCGMLQRVLRCVAVRCSMCCSVLQRVLQCVPSCVFLCAAVPVAACCSLLQCQFQFGAVCCSISCSVLHSEPPSVERAIHSVKSESAEYRAQIENRALLIEYRAV